MRDSSKSMGDWHLRCRQKREEKIAISICHEISIKIETIIDLLTHHLLLTFGGLVVDSYGVTVELSCGDELLDGFFDRS